jgi:hypothetical protein
LTCFSIRGSLTPLAGVGLAVVIVGAAVYHTARKEYRNLGFNLFLLILAALAAYGRFVLAPL